MNNNKKLLAASLAANGLFLTSVNVNAMEDGKKIVTMRSISEKPENKGKPLWEVIGTPKGIIPKSTKDLPTKDEVENFLNGHKEEIVWAVHSGDEARKAAMPRAKLIHQWREEINPALAAKFKELGIKNSMDAPTLDHSLTLFKKKEYKEHQVGGYLNVDPTKTAEENWSKLGRGPLHNITKNAYTTNSRQNKIKEELKRLANGEINCTCWADLITWFLLENGIKCSTVGISGHQFSLTEVKGTKGSGIYLCRIDVVHEKGYKPEEIKFKVEYLTDRTKQEINSKQWDGLVTASDGSSYSDSKYHITPLYEYQDRIQYIMKNIISKTERMNGLINGYKKEIKNLGKKLTDGKAFWNVRISPREFNTLVIPLNLDQLGEARNYCKGFENLKSTSDDGDEAVAYIYADIPLPPKWKEDYKYGAVILEKPDLENRIINAKLISNDKKKTTNLTGKIKMMDWKGDYNNKHYKIQVKRFHGWWDDPNYHPPKIEEIPTIKEKK